MLASIMANFSVFHGTKCLSSRKISLLNFLGWCLIFQFLIIKPCTSLMESCVNATVCISNSTINVLYGQPLEIFCWTNEKFNASDLELRVGSDIIPTEVYNNTTIRYYSEKPAKQLTVMNCRNRKRNENNLTRVLVDSPPLNVTDFRCISLNVQFLNCSWTTASPRLNQGKITYTLYTLVKNQMQSCNVSSISTTRYCVWNTTSQPRYRQLESKFTFVLNGTSIFGENIQYFTIDHYSIIKPNPPSNLVVTKTNPHNVTLEWNIPNEMLDFTPGVNHRIEYQIAKIDHIDYFRNVDTSNLPKKGEKISFTLNLPYAHMRYEIRIYIRCVNATKEEFWSAFSFIVVHTTGERPKRPPDMVAGSFDQSVFNNYRVIYIYWKQIEFYEEAGANFTYRALVQQGSKTSTVYPEQNKSMSYIVLDKASKEEIRVRVWSQNDQGSSMNSSFLYIPSLEQKSLGLSSVTKLAYENGTYELSWNGNDDNDNYTLFWCPYNATKVCNGLVDFKVLNGDKKNHILDLPKEERYQFAISANKGLASSGMVWTSKCDISKDNIAMYRFPMHLNWGAPSSTFVRLYWGMECTLQDGIITGYKLFYCPVLGTSNLCDPSVKNQTKYISDPKEMGSNITGLIPNRTYKFTIALNTTYGLKTIENTTARFSMLEDTPTKPRNIEITEIKNNSLVVSWDPPEQRNGKIGKYVINNFNQMLKEIPENENTVRQLTTLNDLNPFSNYSITIQACNNAINRCSEVGPNDAIVVKTKIGRPSRLKAPDITTTKNLVQWDKPFIAGGTLDLYQIKIEKGDRVELFNTTQLSFSIEQCAGSSDEKYQVRAVNYDENENSIITEYPGEWSDYSSVACRGGNGLTTFYIIMGVFVVSLLIYGSVRFSKWKLERDSLKPPKFPDTLRIPEKDPPKHPSNYGVWGPPSKEDKTSSDEVLLLPGNKNMVSTPDLKNNEAENCAASDHTDSTALSDSSRGPGGRQDSISDNSSNSSLHIDADQTKDDETVQDEEDESDSNTESSRESSPYLNDKSFKKNPTTGYVQAISSPTNGYVQSADALKPQAPSTSYVMAGLAPPIFTLEVPDALPRNPKLTSGYVRAEDLQAQSMNMPKHGPSPTKVFGPESLPTLSPLPMQPKHSDIFQLQSFDSLASLKPSIRSGLPIKPVTSGYVSPEDAVLNKHLNNILSPSTEEEPALLDPTMSADAYCRFSWSNDRSNDNLKLYQPAINSSNN